MIVGVYECVNGLAPSYLSLHLIERTSAYGLWRGRGGQKACPSKPRTTTLRVVKGIFVIRDQPLFSPVKCEMAIFFLVNRDFYSSREP